MKLFDKRPLALILCITVGGFVIFSFSSEIIRLSLLILSVLLGLFSIIFVRGKSSRTITAIAAVALLFSMLLSYVYFDHHFNIANKYSDEVEIEAVIYDIEFTDYSATVLMKSRKIDGEVNERRLVGYIDKDKTLSIDTGSVILFSAKLKDFDSDSRSYYYSRGISATVGEIEYLTVTSQNEAPLEARLADFRKMLMRRAIILSDNETGTLVSALLLGERSFLGGNVSLDFKTVGISHILALSGLHLTILAAGLTFLLSLLGINKKWRVLIIIIVTILYMALAGFSASIMRAGIMLIISSMLFLLSSTHDALSSLVLSVFLILIFTPYAIYDLSLWLSAFATLGIIAFSELHIFKNNSTKRRAKLIRFIITALLSSVFAVSATLSFTAVFFGTVSPLGPIATLIFGIPTEIIMYLGTLMLLLGDIIPIGIILSPIAKGILYLVHLMAEIPGALSSTGFVSVEILIAVFTVLFYLYLIIKVKHKRIALVTLAVLFTAVFIAAHVSTVAQKAEDTVTYLSENAADAFIVKSGSKTSLIDSSKQTENISYIWLERLSEENIVSLDKYYLTHYSKKSVSAVEAVISKLRTKELCLPAPQNESEENILKNLVKLKDKYNIKISLIEINSALEIGGFTLRQFYNTPYGEGTSMVGLSIKANDKNYLYLSSGMYEGKTKAVALSEMQESSTVIFGSHGKKYSDGTCFDKRFSKIWTIILGSNNLTLTETAHEYYELSGGEIYISPTAIDVLR